MDITPIVAALIGAFGGAAAGVSGDFFRRRDERKYAQQAQRRLKETLLDSEFEWRRFDTLLHVAGAAPEEAPQVRKWLITLGARPSGDGKDIWTLKKRTETMLSKSERIDRVTKKLQSGPKSLSELATAARLTEGATERLLDAEIGAVQADVDSDVWQLP